MRRAGIDPEALRRPEMVVDYGAFCTLLQDCAIAWDLPDLGLRMARHQHIDVLGPVALIVKMERTVRSALHAITSNLVIHSNAIVAALEETEGSDTACLIVDVRDDAPASREATELIMGQAKIVVDSLADARVDLVEVAFRHERGLSAGAVARYFGCPVRYGADRNQISFDRSVLDVPLERTDAVYSTLIRRYLTVAKAEVAGGFIEDARSEVARQMELGSCTLENVADSLRTSPRSLQRQLKLHGTSFRELVDEWRRDRALALVTHTRLPLSEVSDALGYSEQSVFTSAFRRWYGGTPLRYRAEAGLAAAP
jgi:AraC-like DNA-binding protein